MAAVWVIVPAASMAVTYLGIRVRRKIEYHRYLEQRRREQWAKLKREVGEAENRPRGW